MSWCPFHQIAVLVLEGQSGHLVRMKQLKGLSLLARGPRGMMSLIAAVISVVQVVWVQGERWRKLEDHRLLEDLALHVGSTSRSAFP